MQRAGRPFSHRGDFMGRKKAYATPKSFEQAVNRYFRSITAKRKIDMENEAGEPIDLTIYVKPPSVAGLCRHIGISKETWSQYGKAAGYRETVEDARMRMEEYLAEQVCREKGTAGIIFNLQCNFGWTPKSAVAQDGRIEVIMSEEMKEYAE